MKLTNHTHKLPTGWQKVRLGNVVNIMGGGTPKTNNPEYWGGDIPWFSVVDAPEDGTPYICKTTKTITSLGLNNCASSLFPKGTIIISARGTVGKIGITAIPMAMNQSCYALRSRAGLNQNFLYYLLKNTVSDLQNRAHGGVFDTITKSTFDLIDAHLPPPPEQEAIARVLGSLDDKIQHNKEQNKILEETARTLFQDWFVNFGPVKEKINAKKENRPENPYLEPEIWNLFPNILNDDGIPESWDKAPLSSQIQLLGGGTPKTTIPKYWDGNIPWFSIKDSSSDSAYIMRTEKTITRVGLDSCSSPLLPIDTVIISARGTVGQLVLTGVPMGLNQSCYGIRSLIPNTQYFLYLLLQRIVEELKQRSHGSVFGTITRATFDSVEITQAPPKIILAIESYIKPLFQKIHQNEDENRHLIELRDYLLPRLISGKIRVKFQNPKN